MASILSVITIDIDPFSVHDKTHALPDKMGENSPFTPGGAMGGSTWEPQLEPEQETSFGGGGKTQRTRLKESG